MSLKKFPINMHLNVDAFLPATEDEKAYMVQMRPSSTFFKDGVKRLMKNPVAVISFIVIVVLVLTCVLLPMFWPYGYDEMLGMGKYGRMDDTYNNLAPMEFSPAEDVKRLGKASLYEIFIEAPMSGTSYTDKTLKNAAKERAEGILAEFMAGDRSAASFEALKSYDNQEVSNKLLAITYAEYKDTTHSSFKGKTLLTKWIWSTDFFGNVQREPGETEVVASELGYHVVYFAGYSGETESVLPHFFGTDSRGRDYLIRVVYGMRVSLAVGLFASIIVLIIGMIVGSIAGYCGGIVDIIIMRVVDIIYSLPDMLMVILLATVFKTLFGDLIKGTFFEAIGGNIISLFIVFALLYWVSMARLIRGQILSLREQEYVLSAKATGAGSRWIIAKHLVPNCISVIIISTALQIPSAIFTESYLSYLGLGVNAPMPSLGSLASDALNGYATYPYRLIIPAVVISLIVLSLNLFGDGLRDAFDPKLKK